MNWHINFSRLYGLIHDSAFILQNRVSFRTQSIVLFTHSSFLEPLISFYFYMAIWTKGKHSQNNFLNVIFMSLFTFHKMSEYILKTHTAFQRIVGEGSRVTHKSLFKPALKTKKKKGNLSERSRSMI